MILRTTDKQRQTILNRIWADFEFGESVRNNRITDWDNARSQYDSTWVDLEKTQDDEDVDLQWLYVPKTRIHIDRIRDSVKQHFFPRGRKKLAKVQATDPNRQDLVIAAGIADKMLHAKMDLAAEPEEPIMHAAISSLVEGPGWIKAKWDFARNIVDYEYVENEALVYDPYAKVTKQIQWVAHEVYYTVDELYALARRGIVENVGEIVEGPDDVMRDPHLREKGATSNKTRKRIRLVEYWGPLQFLDDNQLQNAKRSGKYKPERDVVALIYENKVILRLEDNQYAHLFDAPAPFQKLPFFKMTPKPRRFDPSGDSLVLMLKPLQRENNSIRNQRRIAVDLETNPKFLYDQNRLTDLDRLLQAQWGGPVPVSGNPADVVHQFNFDTSTHILAQEENIVDQDMRGMTGISTYMEAMVVPGQQQTATGVMQVTSEGNLKLDTIIDFIGQAITDMADFTLQCMIEWCTAEDIMAVIGAPEQLDQPTQELIGMMGDKGILKLLAKDFHIELEAGASTTSKQVRLQQIQFGLTALGQIANAMPAEAGAAARELIIEMLKELGSENVARFLTTTNQLQQQGVQNPAATQTGAGGGGMMQPAGRPMSPFETPNR